VVSSWGGVIRFRWLEDPSPAGGARDLSPLSRGEVFTAASASPAGVVLLQEKPKDDQKINRLMDELENREAY